MTNRERMLAAMAGETPDRIPWIPRLLIWYNARKRAGTLPERYRHWPLRDIERDLGMGTPARDGHIFRATTRGVEVRVQDVGEMETLAEHVTPVGSVTTTFRGSEVLRDAGIGDMQTGFALKTRDDYAVASYIVENTEYTATYDDYEAYELEVGDDGYPLTGCGNCPFHHWMQRLAGYNDAYLHLHDFPEHVEGLLDLMMARDRERLWPVILDSPAKLILHGSHFSSQMTPPPVFERYILPYYQELSSLLQQRGKTLCLHADADVRLIASHVERAGYGMVESFVTHPMVDTTLAEARAAWGDRVIVWGGVPSAILEAPYSDAEFEAYMAGLFDIVAGRSAFILGVADNIMPGAKLHRLKRIAEMVEARG